MSLVHLFDRSRCTENVRLRDGKTLCVRLVASDDAEALQRYFRQLSARSRYNRFLGAISELPASQLDHFVSAGENGRFTVTAAMMVDDRERIVGEARSGFEAETGNFEFGISIDDRWQGQGIGSALLRNLECRAAAMSAHRVFGDTLRSNEAMIALARKSGYAFTRHPDDWRLARFEKPIDPLRRDIPCASRRHLCERRALEATV
ncbi:GNAT family N-acetyltransferase [Bradyrhizobium sp.]|uniref:GNAT family N-acetyltransferase n=1 Tax=Bradyrhizobium sp. TaxID=376 RepID=UPI00262DB9B1|nr:GNAT family N-acetyltransferase [Bradyrhizobium sp.]